MVLTFGSLFSGIGGLDMAVEACGWKPAWQVEQDPFCTKILERHWPDVRRYGDIREVDWRGVARVELVCGGFPCQPFSVAGQNRGEDDERNMWPETLRAVRELGPRYVFLENVPGLLAHEYFGTILGHLAESGYDAVWDTFTAAEVGAPHRRERLFILAYATIQRLEYTDEREPQTQGRREARISAGRDGQLAHSRQQQELVQQRPQQLREPTREGVQVADAESPNGWSGEPNVTSAAGLRRRGLGSSFPPGPDDRDAWARVLAEVPALEPALCRVATGVPDRTHRLRALGNTVVPAQGAYALRSLWQRME